MQRHEAADPLHQARQDPLHQPPRRRPHVGAGAAQGRAAGGDIAGFTPRPKISFGLALPTGAESIAEYVDVELADGLDRRRPRPARRRSAPDALPDGFDVLVAAERPRLATSHCRKSSRRAPGSSGATTLAGGHPTQRRAARRRRDS